MNTEEMKDRILLKQLVDQFSVYADTKEFDKQIELFADDAVLKGKRGNEVQVTATGKGAIEQAFRSATEHDTMLFHMNGQQVVSITGNFATGTAYSNVTMTGENPMNNGKVETVSGGTRYQDKYVKKNNVWKISERTTEFIYMNEVN